MDDPHEGHARREELRLSPAPCVYARYGDPHGYPVLYLHGFPGSHREGALVDRSAREHGVSLYALDRPGYGDSPPRPDLTLARWPVYQEQIAQALGFARYGVIALSGGAPYAYAAAYAAHPRLAFTLILAGQPPLLDPAERAALPALMRIHDGIRRILPGLFTREAALLARHIRRHPQWLLNRVERMVEAIDRCALGDPDVRNLLRDSWTWAMRGRGSGLVDDFSRYLTPCPELFQRPLPTPLQVMHGDQDRIVPLVQVDAFVQKLQGVTVEVHAGDGHFSLPLLRQDRIWATIRHFIETTKVF